MQYITEGLKHQFATNIELVAQEKGKLRKLVQEEEIETEVAYFETASNIEALPRTRTDLGGAPGGYGTYVANPVLAIRSCVFRKLPDVRSMRQRIIGLLLWTGTIKPTYLPIRLVSFLRWLVLPWQGQWIEQLSNP